jgi:hypothetical protein
MPCSRAAAMSLPPVAESGNNDVVLASLLPGLRDLRTPLAVGYCWAVAVALWLRGDVDFSPPYLYLASDLGRLVQIVGTGPTLAAVSFVAYLVGAVSMQFQSGAISSWRRFYARSRSRDSADQVFETSISLIPYNRLERRLNDAGAAVLKRRWDEDEEFRDSIIGLVERAGLPAKHGFLFWRSPLPSSLVACDRKLARHTFYWGL